MNNKTTNIMTTREITFRGLKADGSNEWVHGYYRKWFNSSDGKEVHIISNDYGEGNLVIPETVGQFCGLTDKNGTRVFEGDKVKYFNKYSNQWYEQTVKWDNIFACFALFNDNGKFAFESDWVKIQSIEVIGNIHQK